MWRWLICAAALMPAGCGLFNSGPEIRYRITVEVDTPEGVRSGTGVWSLKLRPGNFDQAYNARIRGEAIPVDLPGGRTIFALLEVPVKLPEDVVARRYFPEARYPTGIGPSRPKQIAYIRRHIRNKIELDCRSRRQESECPILVAFKSPMNPTSVYELNPDDLPNSLGRGFSLRGVYLQVTDDAPTNQLENRLPWLDRTQGKTLDGSTVSDYSTLANTLTFYSFKRWDK